MGRAALRIYQILGLPGAGLIFLLEGIGVPIPVEIPLLIVGQRMAQGSNSYWEIVFLMWGTTVIGNTIGYLLGYYGGRPLARQLLSWFRISPEIWEKIEHWFQKHGLKVVIATRWINWGFAQNMWLCGITKVPFGRFFLVMTVNDFLWAMGWTWIAQTAMIYFARKSARFLHSSTIKIGVTALVVAVVGVGVWLLVRWLWNRRKGTDEQQNG